MTHIPPNLIGKSTIPAWYVLRLNDQFDPNSGLTGISGPYFTYRSAYYAAKDAIQESNLLHNNRIEHNVFYVGFSEIQINTVEGVPHGKRKE